MGYISAIKNIPISNLGDTGLIPGCKRSPGVRNGNLLLYSCLENPMDREAWQSTVHGVAKLDMTEHALHMWTLKILHIKKLEQLLALIPILSEFYILMS